MYLIFVNELGPNYKGENIYEFIFSEKIDELWGDDWDSSPAHGKPGPPETVYINKVGVLSRSNVKLELIQNSDYFGMEDALDKVIALGWETFEDSDNLIENERLVFHFGDTLTETENKLYARDLILDFEKDFLNVKE
tara:strand:+ start:113 stop:523 length:411 start_codon:yes stop_codon:yes gene_type:complete